MTPADIPAAVCLEVACFSHPWSAASFQSAFAAGATRFFAALEGETLLGYCGLQVAADEGSITNVAVSPTARRQGVGAALIAAMLAFGRAHSLSQLFLEVRPSNIPAIRLYEKAGFQPVGRRRGFYTDPPEDALIYTLVLSDSESVIP